MTLDASRRALLERSRADGLLRSAFSIDLDGADVTAAPFGIAALVPNDAGTTDAWVVSMSDDLAVLGGVLVWLDRHAPATANLIVDHHAGVHARRAEMLAPETTVWVTRGTDVVRAEPEEIPPPRPYPTNTSALESILAELDLEVVCEDGLIRGELAGLEVARILEGADGPVLEAGVGRFDREAGVLLQAGRPIEESVASAAAQVRPHRTRGAHGHAVNRLARERWLRSEIVAEPSRAGISLPELVEPIPPRANLLEVVPAALLGTDGDRRVLVACSAGVDLGLLPAVADLVRVHTPDEVRIVVPPRDRLAHLDRSIARLPIPASIVTADPPWDD